LPQEVGPINRKQGTQDALPLAESKVDAGWTTSLKNYGAMLQDIGLQYRVLSYAELSDNVLVDQKYRVLILPHSVALSDAEIDAVRQFIAAGGMVLADRKPGVLDEHCRVREAWPLKDIF